MNNIENEMLGYDIHLLLQKIKDATEGAIEYDEQLIASTMHRVWSHNYYKLVAHFHLSETERIAFVVSILPVLMPGYFDNLKYFEEKAGNDKYIFGGRTSPVSGHTIPSLQTLYTLLSLVFPSKSTTDIISDFLPTARVFAWDIIGLHTFSDDIFSNALLLPSVRSLSWLKTGEINRYTYSLDFPAKKLTTRLHWDDLVLPKEALTQIDNIIAWVDHKSKKPDLNGASRFFTAGYKVLFHGPPGTGKSMTASLIGAKTGKEVYCIDLSMLVSKYIGETEKNLSRIFDAAEANDWILFFDEADSIFGKRTSVNDSHDRFANQEVSYLLQRIEQCSCLIILASNYKNNIDSAFSRRFQAFIQFPVPNASSREKLWDTVLSHLPIEKTIDVKQLSGQYEITGGNIINAVQYAYLQSIKNHREELLLKDIGEGIKREYSKEGRII